MDFGKVRNIVILGAGESGVGAAILAVQKGFNVWVSDFGEIKPEYKQKLVDQRIEFEEKNHNKEKILEADVIIRSPGISDYTEVMKLVHEQKIPVVSEIEFAYHFAKGKIISITGSNGKTTTTMLIYHILKTAGFDVCYGGNVGVSFAARVAEKDWDYYVLEISSFQLDDICDFKSDIALLLNITPDHLDRYHYNLEEYANSKLKIADNQSEKDYFIYNLDDEITMKYIGRIVSNGQKIPFSHHSKPETGAYAENDRLIIKTCADKQTIIDMNILSLVGKHNRYNSMAASAAAQALDIRDEVIRKSLSSFQNIEHRLEFVAKIHGIDFINDSKATNINSTWYALESMTKPTVWIVGGVDKGNDYTELKPLVEEKVKAIVCLGVDNQKIIDSFREISELIFETGSMKDAVELGYKLSDPGDVVLLSPACASFDLFRNYEDRGRKFKDAVKNL